MLRGDIYFASLGEHGVGSEQKGDRYVVIVQNNIGNQYSPTVIVAHTTTALHKPKLPTHVEIDLSNSGISDHSIILCEQLRTIDKSRLGKFIGHLNKEKMEELNKALKISLGL